MTRIEDRLTNAARELHRTVDDQVDTDAAFQAVSTPPRPRKQYLLAAAAAILVALVAGVALIATDRDSRQVIADGAAQRSPSSPRTPGTTDPGVSEPAELRVGDELRLVFGGPTNVPVGTLSYAGTTAAFELQWRDLMVGPAGDPPTGGIDFGHHVVLSITSCSGRLLGLDRVDDELIARFVEPAGECSDGEPPPETYAVEVDRADVPRRFALVLPASADSARAAVRLDVDQDEDSAVHLGSSGSIPIPDGSDLVQAELGREITFEGVGDVRLGQVLDPSAVQPFEGSTCGYWGPAEPTHDGDEPPGGLVDGAGTAAPTVLSIQVRNDRYRTASGVGVGTTLATLQRIYGDDLVVDPADGWETATDGLLASYQDVAAVRSGDRALTFGLRDDVVEWVKLSDAGFWGDDEGCA